jgi:hypothetical protein
MRSYVRTRIPAVANPSISLKRKQFLMDSTFIRIGVRRLEAAAALQNERGNGAPPVMVRAAPAGMPWRSSRRNAQHLGGVRWSILGEYRLHAKAVMAPKCH